MADIRIDGDQFEVVMGGLEKLEAAHGNLHFPLSAVAAVEVVDQPLSRLQGYKLVGAGIPGSTAVGIWVGPSGRTFAVEHHASRGIVIQLSGQSYQELLIGSDDPEALAELIRGATGKLPS
ncbi:MAG: hypothetical protein ACRENY_08800 [Candidatus Dormibacteria bacterium]